MAKFVISKEGGRFFLKKYVTDVGVDITDCVEILCGKTKGMRDGTSITMNARKSTPMNSPLESIKDARTLAERMNRIIKEMTGVDALDGEAIGKKVVFRAMIAYRLHLLGFNWQISAGAVGRNVGCVMRISPMRFVSDDNPIWNKIVKVR